MFPWSKIKRHMYFETDDYAELSDFYYGEIDKLNNYSSGMNTKYIEERLDKITKRQNYDEDVLDYRSSHQKQWEKYLAKLERKERKAKVPTPPPIEQEKPQEPIQCTAVELINHDLLTSPTQVDADAGESNEE